MREAVAAMDEGLHNREKYIEADLDFHLALAEAADNPLILALIDSIVELLREQRSSILDVKGGPERGQFHHKRILKAVERRDPEAAKKAMGDHLNRSGGCRIGESPASKPIIGRQSKHWRISIHRPRVMGGIHGLLAERGHAVPIQPHAFQSGVVIDRHALGRFSRAVAQKPMRPSRWLRMRQPWLRLPMGQTDCRFIHWEGPHDMSTVSPEVSRALAAKVREKGATWWTPWFGR
jgi:hypothetical protein